MKLNLLSFLSVHRGAVISGALAGIVAGIAAMQWLVDFAPSHSESSTLPWQAANWSDANHRTPHTFYRPRFDALLQRLRENGRFEGTSWQDLKEVVNAWLRVDPVACLNHLIEKEAIGLIDDTLLDLALQRATGGNFGVALKTADEINNAAVRKRWITRAFIRQVKVNPKDAFLALDSIPKRFRVELQMMLTDEWVARDPEEAVRAFIDAENFGVGYAAICWARRDPKAAFGFIANVGDDFRTANGRALSRAHVLKSVLIGMQQSDPELTIELIKTLPASMIRNRELTNTFSALAKKDPTLALQLAETLQGDIERLRALQATVSVIAQSDPVRGAELRQRLPGERARAASEARAIAGRFGDYEKRAESVRTITDPIARSDATHQMAINWFLNRPDEIGEYALREAEQSGNPIWLNAIADYLVDRAQSDASRAQEFEGRGIEKLPPAARAWLRNQIAAGPVTEGRESVLKALE